MKLEHQKQTWHDLGRRDPLWAVLTEPGKEGNRWQPEDLFATGHAEVEALLQHAATHELPSACRRALDFGCGVGRLTQALAERFEECWGVDIAPSMLELAREHNRHGERCRYVLNDTDDLGQLPSGSFDLVYSRLVLQHIEPRHSRRYVGELVRVLSPQGLLVFQVPSEEARSRRASLWRAPSLPRTAFRACLRVDPLAEPLVAAGKTQLRVQVTNESADAWSIKRCLDAGHPLSVGNHWRDAKGEMLVRDDGRAALPSDLGPGESCTLDLSVNVPPRTGTYMLEIDLVLEGVAWFAHRGSRPLRLTVSVGDAPSSARPSVEGEPTAPLVPQMAMYALPRSKVEALVTRAGGRILDAIDDGGCGRSWVSYRYCVKRL